MKIRKTLLFLVALTLLALPTVNALPKKDYNTITEGEIFYSAGHYLAGQPIPTGFDLFGYNYQGHLFKGSYFNAYSGGAGFPPYEGDDEAYLAANPKAASHWAWPYRDTQLLMKWNDAWLSNMDRNDDNKLDRHYGYTTYIGSGAWETNHMWGENDDGTQWNYYCNIVAAPVDATKSLGVWYTSDGTEIGPDIWGEFAVIFEVSNDPSTGDHGVIYNAPAPTGFGYYKP